MTYASSTDPFTTPGIASAEDGHVLLDGPNGVAIALTAEAAHATGKSLMEAAQRALAQRGSAGKDG